MIHFEGIERRKNKIDAILSHYGMKDLEEAREITLNHSVDVEELIKGVQPIAFDNAVWAYILGASIALKKGDADVRQIAKAIGEGLQAFTIPGSVAEQREVGTGHGGLASMLLDEKTRVFAFVAGHESFAAAEGALGVTKYADTVRKEPLKVVLIGLGKDAANIIGRMTGFTFVETRYDFGTGQVHIVNEKKYTKDNRANVRIYGTESVDEGIAIMKLEKVDVSITGNSTNPTRFTHPVVATYKKWCVENGKAFFSVASGGGTGRTLHPDNVAAGSASYGMTDTMGRMHSDAQFAGSSSVPAHVDMMGFIGMGNNPMVGATVALAVRISDSLK